MVDRASGEEATSGAIKTIIAMVIIPNYCDEDDIELEEDHDRGDGDDGGDEPYLISSKSCIW